MTSRKLSMAHNLHGRPNILIFFAGPASLYCEKMYIYIYVSIYIYTIYAYTLTYTYLYVLDTPNNTASETFLHKSGAVQGVDWIFFICTPGWH